MNQIKMFMLASFIKNMMTTLMFTSKKTKMKIILKFKITLSTLLLQCINVENVLLSFISIINYIIMFIIVENQF